MALDRAWKRLQNGSDIRGVALPGVPDEDVNLTPAVMTALGAAFVQWLAKGTLKAPSDLRVAVGMDSRLSGPELKAGLVRGITAAGASAGDAGLASTPAMFMSTVLEPLAFDGGLMLTASHLPFNRNGLKCFTAAGGLNKADITEILSLAAAADLSALPAACEAETVDVMSAYAGDLVARIRDAVNHPEHYDAPLRGFKIVVDAGNGAGGFFVEKILVPLGADTGGSQFLDPDGTFPNHIPNPEDRVAMEAISGAVRRHQADLGVIFDTDVDRAAAVGADGRFINRNRLIALIAAILLEQHPGTTIVTDSITSDGLAAFIRKRGGVHHRFKRGYKNVINEAVRLNAAGQDTQLAIETSGHAALKENRFLDDGAYLIIKLLIKMARLRLEGGGALSDLIADLPEPRESTEYRATIGCDDFAAEGNRILRELETYAAKQPGWHVVPDNHEGVRIGCDADHGNGWFLVRLSLHDPVLPMNLESDEAGGVARIREQLLPFLQRYATLDLSALAAEG